MVINYYYLGSLSDPNQNIWLNKPYHFFTSINHAIIFTLQAVLTPIANLLNLDNSFNEVLNKFYLERIISNEYINLALGRFAPLDILTRTRSQSENIAWFGMGTFIVIGGIIYGIKSFLKDKKNKGKLYAFLIILFSLSFFYLYAFTMKWQPWASRFMITPFLLLSSISVVLFYR